MLKVRFSANNGIFSRLIRFVTWSKYSHFDFVLPDGSYLGALVKEGVCIHNHKQPVELFCKVDVTEEEAEKILEFAKKQIGKKYDFTGILGFGFRRGNWQDDDSWFCSELGAAAIQSVKRIFNEDAYRISPRDLEIHSIFTPLNT